MTTYFDKIRFNGLQVHTIGMNTGPGFNLVEGTFEEIRYNFKAGDSELRIAYFKGGKMVARQVLPVHNFNSITVWCTKPEEQGGRK